MHTDYRTLSFLFIFAHLAQFQLSTQPYQNCRAKLKSCGHPRGKQKKNVLWLRDLKALLNNSSEKTINKTTSNVDIDRAFIRGKNKVLVILYVIQNDWSRPVRWCKYTFILLRLYEKGEFLANGPISPLMLWRIFNNFSGSLNWEQYVIGKKNY